MTPVDQELLDLAIEGLATHNNKITAIDKTVKQVDEKVVQVEATIKQDVESIKSTLTETAKQVILDIGLPKDGKDGETIVGPEGKSGKDGRPGKDGKSGRDGKTVVGPKGTPGRDGKDGKTIKGDKGKDGTGIKDIKAKDEKLEIELTDGRVKKVHIPVRYNDKAPASAVIKTGSIYEAKDTYIPKPLDGQVLTYDTSTRKWIAATPETSGVPPVTDGSSNTRLAVRAKEAMSAGTAVMYDSYNSGTNTIEVVKANNTLGVAIGITETSLDFNAIGNIITSGTLEGVDTSGYAEGQILYTGVSGQLVATEPSTGFGQPIAFVLKSQQNNGAILITTDYPKQGAEDVRYGSTTVAAALDAVNAGNIDSFQARAEIESMFKVAELTAYKELTYVNGNITNVDIYTTSGKTTKLFSKIIGYNNGNISTISITDSVNGGTLNKILNYSNSNLLSVESTYEVI